MSGGKTIQSFNNCYASLTSPLKLYLSLGKVMAYSISVSPVHFHQCHRDTWPSSYPSVFPVICSEPREKCMSWERKVNFILISDSFGGWTSVPCQCFLNSHLHKMSCSFQRTIHQNLGNNLGSNMGNFSLGYSFLYLIQETT